ncbi:MAG: PTS fructose transporter subunit IIA [Deltaproteobacteria bacterium]|nr:PTS fructose transporter subunit IIA [Deltaproteobacteria bacterium]MBW1953121.1 PTS fructose transporter subunit IIA [Deltaproteobacteria bacterium]MBW1986403.1 PTS fructose transporter subunit IIA [Deltaproteobacteria bacterium]MBW2133798.1 PTS fructose transporter subunit IIA [Deltaproteobacteria bacterium]
MIGVLIVTHHPLAEALLSTCDLILGHLDRVLAVSLDPGAAPENSRRQIAEAMAQINDGQGVLILTDMFGGTPSNLSLSFLKNGQIEVVTGVNLPMLMQLAQIRQAANLNLHEAALALKQSGQRGISVASEVLSQK